MNTSRLVNLSVVIAVLISVLGGFATAQAAPLVIYVDLDATGADDGTSWGDAFVDLQSALAIAVSGDEIWVADGEYYPGLAGNNLATFQLKNEVALYGGFSGTETTLEERDWTANTTTLSGDIDGEGTLSGNVYHVVTGSGTDTTAILDGFTITAGNANSNPNEHGGGVYNQNGSPMLTNLTIFGNSVNLYGGGMYNNAGNPTLKNVTFSGNTAGAAGVMYNSAGSLTLINVIFSNNSVTGSAGGLYSSSSTLNLTDVTFSANSAHMGGGMLSRNNISTTLMEVSFSDNTATAEGGGMYNEGSDTTSLMNVTFSGNSSGDYGGGLVNNAANPTLINVTFTANLSGRGGGIANVASSPVLTNVTLYGNSAGVSGGGIYNTGVGSPMLTNCILWGNTAAAGAQI